MKQGTAIIIGAGPAGLTAAIELQRGSGIKPILIEASQRNRRHLPDRPIQGQPHGHRRPPLLFQIRPRHALVARHDARRSRLRQNGSGSRFEPSEPQAKLRYQGQQRDMPQYAVRAPIHKQQDLVMLVRQRKSRIYFLRRFFDYPISLTAATFRNLGLVRTVRCGVSYMRSALLPQREERTLEDFIINRFGKQLYLTFFKSYTEKVWGVPCNEISAEWGAQRIKGLSLKGVVLHFLKKTFGQKKPGDIAQKKTETSLIEKFLYPKFGPGQLWEHAAELVRGKPAARSTSAYTSIASTCNGNKIVSLEGVNAAGERVTFAGDYFFSTMPVRDLDPRRSLLRRPPEVIEVSEGLMYRDFITVGLLASKLAVTEKDGAPLKDNWIYIQEPDVMVGRLQIFNNWSPWLVADQDKVWIGLEYFCNDTDPCGSSPTRRWPDSPSGRSPKSASSRPRTSKTRMSSTCPRPTPPTSAATTASTSFAITLTRFENLFLVGRNGMHKYNNQDHSMLTAMTAVENIVNGVTTKDNIWAINTEMEYHEEKAAK